MIIFNILKPHHDSPFLPSPHFVSSEQDCECLGEQPDIKVEQHFTDSELYKSAITKECNLPLQHCKNHLKKGYNHCENHPDINPLDIGGRQY